MAEFSKLEMAQQYADDPTAWASENNNANKIDPNDPYTAPWDKVGLDEASWRRIYSPPSAPTPAPSYAPTSPVAGIDNSDPFGSYLKNNPGRADAWAYLENLLNDYGLGDLNSFIKEQIVEGRSQVEIAQRLREQPTYKKRFAVIEQRKAKGLTPMSEAEVISYEDTVRKAMRSAGMPEGFYDSPDDFVNLMSNDVSAAEVVSRVNNGYLAAMSAPAEERKQLANLYGITDGDLAAYYLDPTRTENLLKQRFAAAQASAEGVRSGYGSLNQSEAERLASLGVTGQGAAQGFNQLVQQRELFNSLPGQQNDQVTRDQQLAAAFGNDANQQQRLKRTAESRVAQFENGSQYVSDRTGYAGLGVAR